MTARFFARFPRVTYGDAFPIAPRRRYPGGLRCADV